MSRKSHFKRKTLVGPNIVSNKAAVQVFLKRFYSLADMAGCTDACRMLSKHDKKNFYYYRVHLSHPKIAKGHPISHKSAKALARIFRNFSNMLSVTLIEGKEKVSIIDALTVLSFEKFLESFYEGEAGDKYRTAFKPLLTAYHSIKNPMHQLYELYNLIMAGFNSCNRSCFGINTSYEFREFPVAGVYQVIQMLHYFPQKKALLIDGKYRPVFRLGWPSCFGKMNYQNIAASKLGDMYKGKNENLEIFIQSHAIRRFRERTLPCLRVHSNMSMMLSFSRDDRVQIFKGKLLFAYYYLDVKTGYFLADVIDDFVIIRTFLFITHHHTPEGTKLEELSGLGKSDIGYWKIDHLATFMNTNLGKENRIFELFEKANLLDLFELKKSNLPDAFAANFDWTDLEDYIQQGQEEQDDMFEEECL